MAAQAHSTKLSVMFPNRLHVASDVVNDIFRTEGISKVFVQQFHGEHPFPCEMT